MFSSFLIEQRYWENTLKFLNLFVRQQLCESSPGFLIAKIGVTEICSAFSVYEVRRIFHESLILDQTDDTRSLKME